MAVAWLSGLKMNNSLFSFWLEYFSSLEAKFVLITVLFSVV